MTDAERYDAELDQGREPATPCCVCTGDEEAEPCTEECAALVTERAKRVRIRGLYIACSRALEWARAYARQGTTFGDARILAIVDQVQDYRRQIAGLRAQKEAA